ncbi:hypothetical protein OIDMADRAFT_27399 [Oidiodendron maius Zn]|uniref:Uncharacterized protein n=1 Tax=Oidiodendron maius (strain Zn) TaxID=913774 RepID=A0A0C3HIJ8_OIDMZ|nr:hypothetical protein OIDMADRAFT_27399 [Oidiodendron maius Zn]
MRPSGWHDGQKMLVCAVMRGEVLRYERNGHALVVDTTATCSLLTSGAFPSRTTSVVAEYTSCLTIAKVGLLEWRGTLKGHPVNLKSLLHGVLRAAGPGLVLRLVKRRTSCGTSGMASLAGPDQRISGHDN